MEGKKRDSVY